MPQYHAARVELQTSLGVLRFREETTYPFGDKVKLIIEDAPEAKLTLRFLAPPYLAVNEPVKEGFVVREGVFKKGETVEFAYRLKEGVAKPNYDSNAAAGFFRKYRGPLLLGEDGKTVWHLMAPEIWEKGSGAITVLHK